jgi:ankyrin repeat protein
VQYLVQQRADKDNTTNNNATPLCILSLKDHLVVVQRLVEQGADKN